MTRCMTSMHVYASHAALVRAPARAQALDTLKPRYRRARSAGSIGALPANTLYLFNFASRTEATGRP